MENNSQPPVSTPTTPQMPIEPTVSPSKSNLLVISLVIVEIITLLVAGYFAYQFSQLKKQITQPQPTATSVSDLVSPSPLPSSSETSNWKTYKVQGLGIELKLPSYFSPMDYPNGNETNGEKGKQFCIQYTKVDVVSFLIKEVLAGGGACSPTYFGLGTTSVDYEAGRSGGFGDLQGYTFENGKYYAKMVLGKRFEIPSGLAKEITNPNGVKILRIIGKSDQPTEQNGMSSFPIAGTPGDGEIGALINFDNNATYSGVSVEMKLNGNLNTELFDQILSTIKLTQ